MENFSDFIDRKFREWQNQLGHAAKWKDFAVYLEVPPTTLSTWKNGTMVPRIDALRQLEGKLGSEIYDAIGLQGNSDPLTRYPRIKRAIENMVRRVEASGIDPDSPDVAKIFEIELLKIIQERTEDYNKNSPD